MPRVRFIKDFETHKKGEVAELRAKEAKQAFKANAAEVTTDMGAESYQTKESSDGNTKGIRTHKRSRR